MSSIKPRFSTEPAYSHGQANKTAVLFCNLGTPEHPTAPDLRHYLAEFLSDPRVVEIPKWIWMIILHGIILRTRPAKSAKKYASIWTEQGSPLKVWTEKQAHGLELEIKQRLADLGQDSDVIVRYAMRYGAPSIDQRLSELKAQGVTRVLMLPAYPQYSATTTASLFDVVFDWGTKSRLLPEFRFINHYHDHPSYIKALAYQIQTHWSQHGRSQKLLMSFHGIPQRSLTLGDPYHCECHKTGRLLAEELRLSKDDYLVTFQSRFGKAKWLEPYTEPTAKALAEQGIQSIDVVCPGFTSDCLETLEEIGMEVRETFLHAGGKTFNYIPCLNDSAPWIESLANIALEHLSGWPISGTKNEQERALSRQHALQLGASN
jgi:ferrochelatase